MFKGGQPIPCRSCGCWANRCCWLFSREGCIGYDRISPRKSSFVDQFPQVKPSYEGYRYSNRVLNISSIYIPACGCCILYCFRTCIRTETESSQQREPTANPLWFRHYTSHQYKHRRSTSMATLIFIPPLNITINGYVFSASLFGCYGDFDLIFRNWIFFRELWGGPCYWVLMPFYEFVMHDFMEGTNLQNITRAQVRRKRKFKEDLLAPPLEFTVEYMNCAYCTDRHHEMARESNRPKVREVIPAGIYHVRILSSNFNAIAGHSLIRRRQKNYGLYSR